MALSASWIWIWISARMAARLGVVSRPRSWAASDRESAAGSDPL